jgi:Uma2 family endonuclease
MATEFSPRLFTVDEYHRMVEAGILASGERLELLSGQIVEMSPIGKRHWELHARLVRYLHTVLPDGFMVVGQGSFPLGDTDEPQPDIAIVRCHPTNPRRAADPVAIVGLIEIADSSLAQDIGPKMRLYARFEVADYLVSDVRNDRVVLHSAPHELGYGRMRELARPDAFTLTALPDTPLEAAEFLPDPE